LTVLYLVRHGQAGTRDDYDTLSELGRRQARRAGEYLAAQGVIFRAAYSGTLRRQIQTAEEAACAYRVRGLEFPGIVADPGWNEFDLDTVYREMAPALAAADPQFRREYGEIRRQAADGAHAVHRLWSPCDTAIVRAWIEERHPCSAESWRAFVERVENRLKAVAGRGEAGAVAIFTSAVPMAISVAMALGVDGDRIMKLAAVVYNSAITELRVRDGGELALAGFNGVPHLPERDLRSFR
jgi:broad specificity phosphatase PhoE